MSVEPCNNDKLKFIRTQYLRRVFYPVAFPVSSYHLTESSNYIGTFNDD